MGGQVDRTLAPFLLAPLLSPCISPSRLTNIFVGEGSEWHKPTLNPDADINVLRNNLVRLLQLFPDLNSWTDIPGFIAIQAVHGFQDLADQTWNPYDERAVARFVS
jgi:hypothetical protein